MEKPVSKENWKNAWENNSIGWHSEHVNTNLIENMEFLTNSKQNCRILLPFCGKTLDLLWLVKQGHTVIGAELVKKAIEDFFKENNVSYDKENVGGNDYCYTAFDGRLKIFECNYFQFNSSLAGGKVDAIWDCQALGAVSPDLWSKYLQTSLELLDLPHGRILLQGLLYDQEEFKGPPFSVPKEKLSLVFGNSYELEVLSNKPNEKVRARFGQSWLYDTLMSIKYIS